MRRRGAVATLGAAALVAALPRIGSAQAKPLRFIVPYPPGGPLDIVARALAEKTKDSLGVVIVDNRAGAGGNIGADAAASVRANAGVAGDVMVPKIAGVKVLRQPRDGGGDLQTLGRNDEVILAGDEQNGYTKVTTARGDGWVKTILLRRP